MTLKTFPHSSIFSPHHPTIGLDHDFCVVLEAGVTMGDECAGGGVGVFIKEGVDGVIGV